MGTIFFFACDGEKKERDCEEKKKKRGTFLCSSARNDWYQRGPSNAIFFSPCC